MSLAESVRRFVCDDYAEEAECWPVVARYLEERGIYLGDYQERFKNLSWYLDDLGSDDERVAFAERVVNSVTR